MDFNIRVRTVVMTCYCRCGNITYGCIMLISVVGCGNRSLLITSFGSILAVIVACCILSVILVVILLRNCNIKPCLVFFWGLHHCFFIASVSHWR